MAGVQVVSLRAYVLDDDPLELVLWRVNLHKRDPALKVEAFTTSAEFCRRVDECVPDVAIVDLVLDYDSGVYVCEWLKLNYPEVKVFVNTSYDREDPEVVSRICSADYLSKASHLLDRIAVITSFIQSKRVGLFRRLLHS